MSGSDRVLSLVLFLIALVLGGIGMLHLVSDRWTQATAYFSAAIFYWCTYAIHRHEKLKEPPA